MVSSNILPEKYVFINEYVDSIGACITPTNCICDKLKHSVHDIGVYDIDGISHGCAIPLAHVSVD